MTNNNDIETFVNLVSSNSCIKADKTFSDNIKSTKGFSFCSQDEIINNPNLICKKTNRGRKEKNKIPNDKLKCEVCLELSDCSNETLISCSNCDCFFHKSCYSQYEEITTSTTEDDEIHSYKCIRCIKAIESDKSIYDFKCFICNHSNGVLNYNRQNNIYYHQICLDNIPELNSLKEDELTKEKIKKWRYKNSCKYCGKKLSKSIAVTKCKKPKCKEYYHIPCAIAKGLIFNQTFMKKFYHVSQNNQIPFYCANHNKKIVTQYKNYVMNMKKEINNENNLYDNNEEKKTFLNELKNNEEKNDGDDGEEIEEEKYIWKKCSSKNIKEENCCCCDKIDDYIDEDISFEERKENNDDMYLDESFEKENNNNFDINYEVMKENDFIMNNINLNKKRQYKYIRNKENIGFNTILMCFKDENENSN